MRYIRGRVGAFWETGTEGVEWIFYDSHDKGRDSMHSLDEGDYLRVYGRDDKLYWKGKINYDLETNKEKAGDFLIEQQVVKNYYVHWLQKGVNPNFWADMFFNGMNAELKKKQV